MAARLRFGRALGLLAGGLTLVLGWWGTADSTSRARLAALSPVESAAMAVFEQIVATYAATGRWAQTIHVGYRDAWDWGGHKALVLYLTAALYPLEPSALGLSRIQLAGVLAGAIPAAVLGRQAWGRVEGLLLGAALYLLAPAVMALALQDYQDLVFALPAVLCAAACMRSGSALWAVVGAAVLCLPREETPPMVYAVALVCPPWREGRPSEPWWRRLRWGAWLRNLVIGALVVAYAEAWHAVLVTTDEASLIEGNRSHLFNSQGHLNLDGWSALPTFYAVLFVPFGALGLLSPGPLLVGLAGLGLHLTVPMGQGIDRSWLGHAHHVAPVAGFLLVSAIEGAGRLLRRLEGLPLGRLWTASALAGGLAFALVQFVRFADQQSVRLSLWSLEPAWTHPAWALAELVPADQGLILSRAQAIVASNRLRAWTFDDSLGDKEPRRGLGVAQHLIVRADNTCVIEDVMRMDGAEILAERDGVLLLRWSPSAVDPMPSQWIGESRACPARPEPGSWEPLPGVPPSRAEQVYRITAGPPPRILVPKALRDFVTSRSRRTP
jgi:hypothetical protein